MTERFSDAKVDAVASLLNLFERTTVNMDQSLSNSVKAAMLICLKFVDKRALFEFLLPNTFIDWDYVSNATGMGVVGTTANASSSSVANLPKQNTTSSSNGKAANFSLISSLACMGVAGKKINMLGDSSVWLQLMHFIDFGELKMPERLLQSKYPPLYCMYSTIMSQMRGYHADKNRLNFSDACKLLILNNVEGLTSRNVLELYTSSRLNQNTYALCSNILSTLADERHSSAVYEETFRYVLSEDVMKVNEDFLARYIQHFRQTAAAQRKAWEMKFVQNRSSRPSMRRVAGRTNGEDNNTSSSSLSSFHYNNGNSSIIMNDTESVISGVGSSSSNSCCGLVTLGVSSMTFDQHSTLIR